MSHSVIVTLDHLKNETNKCDVILKQLNNLLEYEWSNETKTLIMNRINAITQGKENILSMEGKSFESEYILSNISKEIENLNMSLNFKDLYNKHIKENSGRIEELIAAHGVLATESISELIINNEKITPEKLITKIDEMRSKDLSNEKLIEYQNIFKKNILDSDWTDDIKFHFINISTRLKNAQEVSDIQPFIASKKIEFNNMKNFVNDVVKTLGKLNFKIQSRNNYEINDEQVFNLKLVFKNSSNNNVIINFNSNGQIKYKLGNYIGHACEKTTDKLLSELTKMGYTYPKPLIRRDIDNSKPILKTSKEREK